MKVKEVIVSHKLTASVKVNWLATVYVEIPIRTVMKALAHPRDWDKIKVNIDSIHEVSEIIYGMAGDARNSHLADFLLKIAGKHPNKWANEVMQRTLNDRDFALSMYRMNGIN